MACFAQVQMEMTKEWGEKIVSRVLSGMEGSRADYVLRAAIENKRGLISL